MIKYGHQISTNCEGKFRKESFQAERKPAKRFFLVELETPDVLTQTTPMTSRFLGFLENDQAGPEGESLEQCFPIPWPQQDSVSFQFVSSLLGRLLAASYRSPDLLNSFALSKSTLAKILAAARSVLSREPNILDVVIHPRGRIHIFGDTHGDLHSLVEALAASGWPSPENILCFAGDCVDRGAWGVEVLSIILALKLWQPQNVFVLRGNHETTGCVSR